MTPDLFTSPKFRSLPVDAIDTLMARLHAVVAAVSLEPDRKKEFEEALGYHRLPMEAGPRRLGLVQVRKYLNRHLRDLPLAAMLSTSLAEGDPLAPTYDGIMGWVVVSSLILEMRDPGHQSKIDDALASVRLMGPSAQREMEHRCISTYQGRYETSATMLAATGLASGNPLFFHGVDRHYYLRVLLDAYINNTDAIRRSRLSDQLEIYYVTRVEQAAPIDLDQEFESLEIIQNQPYIRQNGDRLNLDHERTSTAAMLVTEGNKPDQRPPSHHAYRAQVAIQAMLRRRMSLPCSYGRCTEYEIATLCRTWAEGDGVQFQRDEDLFLFLTLITGRLPSQIPRATSEQAAARATTSEWWSVDGDVLHLMVRPNVTSRNYSAAIRRLLLPLPRSLPLAMPGEISDRLRGLLLDHSRWCDADERTSSFIASTFPKHHRQVTLRRVAGVLRDCLIQHGTDRSKVAFILGHSPAHNPSLYYASHSSADVEQTYRQAVEAILGRSLEWPSLTKGQVGTELNVKPAAVRALYEAASEELKDFRKAGRNHWIRFHNRYAALVCTSLSFLTGHRPVRQPFESLADFDLQNRLLFISDKELRCQSHGRFIPLIDTAVEQVEAWLRHCDRIGQFMGRAEPGVSGAARAARTGTGPFMYQFDERPTPNSIQSAILTPRSLDDHLSNVWPLPLNWGRHYMRTAMSSVQPELVDAFMGHEDPGAEAFSPDSGLSMRDMDKLRNAIADVAAAAGARPLYGLR